MTIFHTTPRFLFIGGCPRSGTTLLGDMLGAAQGALCLPESQFLFRGLPADPGEAFDAPATRVSAWHRGFVDHFRFAGWREIGCGRDQDLTGITQYADLAGRMAAAYAAAAGRPTPQFVIEQSPESIRFADRIAAGFPGARMIHLVRDGRAVANSVLPLDWGPHSILDAARYWLDWVSVGLAAREVLGPDRVMTVRYEDLLRAPALTLKRICQWADLAFDPSMIDGGGLILPGYTKGQHALVGKRPDPGRIDSWQGSLTVRAIELFEALAGDQLRLLGYSLLTRKPKKPGGFERLRLELSAGVKRWRGRQRYRKRRSALTAQARRSESDGDD